MKIECLLRREGGSKIEIPPNTYHFAPQADGRHVAEVEDEDHIARFLSIAEGYRMVRSAAAEVVNTPSPAAPLIDPGAGDPAPVPTGILNGSNVHPATLTIQGKTYQLGTLVARAFQDSGVTVEEWNDLPEDTRAVKIDLVCDALEDGELVLDELPQAPAGDAPQPAGLSDDRTELVAQYVAKFGKSPGNMKADTIKAKLAE